MKLNPRKSALRKLYREKRSQLSAAERKIAAETMAKLFVQTPLFAKSKRIACYLAHKDEIDAMPIIKAIWQANKYCYLPVLTAGKSLAFVEFNKDDELKPNQYNIAEPINIENKLALNELDIVLTPLIAFDLQGYRLGTGGGYYDRTFAFLSQSEQSKPKLIGLAYSIQQAENLPIDEWDIKLDGVITDKFFYVIARS